MLRVGVVFCLLAVAALQVPWIVCTGCCEDFAASALTVHECHAHETVDPHHAHPHDPGCTCGHDTDGEPAERHGPTHHLLVQLPAVAPGVPVVLPDHLEAELASIQPERPYATDAWVATGARHPPDETPPVPRGACERLLL